MADLFDQLKLEGPVQKTNSPPSFSSTKSNFTKSSDEYNEQLKPTSIGVRRESMSSPVTVSNVLKKCKSHKAGSLSPPKHGAPNIIKSLKVKLERKKLEEFLTRPLEEHANNIRNKQEKFKDYNKNTKVTPTKAQQKLFEPLVDQKKSKEQTLKQFNIKPCKVRIRRENMQKLLKNFKSKNAGKKGGKIKNNKILSPLTLTESPPSKKSKLSAVDKGINKSKNSFFIKLNASPTGKVEKRIKHISKYSPSTEAQHNKIKNSKFNTTTAPTKFSRTQLLRSFGKRFFNVQVKIERCTHPLMLTFESNDRARRLQAKRNKSKNLSVSFQEQVEIFGGSSDSDDSCGEDFCAISNNRANRKSNASHPIPAPLTSVVMPARLKKVENGKVVDDIELDPSLFVDPKILVSSTPFSPSRKKRDHKSFSPLKDESSSSPRKEQLKLANEKIPPSGLRRMNIDEDEDEDDDCEYIVPIEMPQRRTSRTSSNTTLDDLTSASIPLADSPVNFPGIFDDYANSDQIKDAPNTNDIEMNNCSKKNTETYIATNLENGSDDSFQSAKDDIESNEMNTKVNQEPSLGISTTSVNVNLNLGIKKSDKIERLQTNGDMCNETNSKRLSTLNTMDDISVNLFLEDSQTNEDDTHTKSFVNSIINETIDKLSKDIDEHATNENCTGTS